MMIASEGERLKIVWGLTRGSQQVIIRTRGGRSCLGVERRAANWAIVGGGWKSFMWEALRVRREEIAGESGGAGAVVGAGGWREDMLPINFVPNFGES